MTAMISDPRWTANQECYAAAQHGINKLVPALTSVISTEAWREFDHPMRGTQRYDRLADYCHEFLELDPQAIRALLEGSRMPAAAEQIRRMLAEDVPEAAPHGANQHTAGVGDTNSCRENDSTYVLARLKRDRPDLAAQVVDGTLSANEAAIAAGIRKRYIRVRADDQQVAIAKLEEHFGIKLKIV